MSTIAQCWQFTVGHALFFVLVFRLSARTFTLKQFSERDADCLGHVEAIVNYQAPSGSMPFAVDDTGSECISGSQFNVGFDHIPISTRIESCSLASGTVVFGMYEDDICNRYQPFGEYELSLFQARRLYDGRCAEAVGHSVRFPDAARKHLKFDAAYVGPIPACLLPDTNLLTMYETSGCDSEPAQMLDYAAPEGAPFNLPSNCMHRSKVMARDMDFRAFVSTRIRTSLDDVEHCGVSGSCLILEVLAAQNCGGAPLTSLRLVRSEVVKLYAGLCARGSRADSSGAETHAFFKFNSYRGSMPEPFLPFGNLLQMHDTADCRRDPAITMHFAAPAGDRFTVPSVCLVGSRYMVGSHDERPVTTRVDCDQESVTFQVFDNPNCLRVPPVLHTLVFSHEQARSFFNGGCAMAATSGHITHFRLASYHGARPACLAAPGSVPVRRFNNEGCSGQVSGSLMYSVDNGASAAQYAEVMSHYPSHEQQLSALPPQELPAHLSVDPAVCVPGSAWASENASGSSTVPVATRTKRCLTPEGWDLDMFVGANCSMPALLEVDMLYTEAVHLLAGNCARVTLRFPGQDVAEYWHAAEAIADIPQCLGGNIMLVSGGSMATMGHAVGAVVSWLLAFSEI